jgi:hypothetical protein
LELRKEERVYQMANIISRCNICDDFFNSKRELRDHKDKNHRITDSKMKSKVLIKTALLESPSMWLALLLTVLLLLLLLRVYTYFLDDAV